MHLNFTLPSVSIHVEALHVHFPPGASDKLDAIIASQGDIMTALSDATQTITDLTAQVAKVQAEMQKLIDAVAAGGAGQTTPEFDAALAGLKTALGSLDDMNPDTP